MAHIFVSDWNQLWAGGIYMGTLLTHLCLFAASLQPPMVLSGTGLLRLREWKGKRWAVKKQLKKSSLHAHDLNKERKWEAQTGCASKAEMLLKLTCVFKSSALEDFEGSERLTSFVYGHLSIQEYTRPWMQRLALHWHVHILLGLTWSFLH